MLRHILAAGVIAVLMSQTSSAQRTNMSDVTGANVGLFSRGIVRAFPAEPAPPPRLIVTPPLMTALCLERADALLVYATLRSTAETTPERTALALLRGGPGSDEAALALSDALIKAGVNRTNAEMLMRASKGLLASEQPDIVIVAGAVDQYNGLVMNAPQSFLMAPPAEFTALRLALGRLTAAANHAFAAERMYPGLSRLGLQYANDAPWLASGQPIEVRGATYSRHEQGIALGDKRLVHVADYEGVWVLAEAPVAGTPSMIYVPIRKYCDIELLPYKLEEKVIKGVQVDP